MKQRLRGKPSSPKPAIPASRTRRFWGWGYEDEGPDPLMLALLTEYLKDRFGIDEFQKIQPPSLDEIHLPAPRFRLPPPLESFCTSDAADRIHHSYGKAYRDVMRALRGEFRNPPDYVAYPTEERQIVELMAHCEREKIALIPFGGGSSVVSGVEPGYSPRYLGNITLDLGNFNRILEVDEVSRCARIQAGIFGPALEDGLKPYGLTLRHYPQSFEFSTLGGWIATRAGGHFSTVYTHIDDMVESLRIVTPRGIHETRRLPASGAGPSQERLWLGSEGILGVITEAWVRLHVRPTYRASATVRFKQFDNAVEAARRLSQSKLYPSNCRLVDPLEAVGMGLGTGRHAMLLLNFESSVHSPAPLLKQALKLCAQSGGQWKRNQVYVKSSSEGERAGGAGKWRDSFLKAPYMRDELASLGLVVETFETAVTWNRFEAFHQKIQDAAAEAFAVHCEGKGIFTCRFTHLYPDGPAPYYTVIAKGQTGKEIEQWDAIKNAVSNAIIDAGGTITHHHAVGKTHRPWYAKERGDLFGEILSSAKNTVDPHWILNPGVLLESP